MIDAVVQKLKEGHFVDGNRVPMVRKRGNGSIDENTASQQKQEDTDRAGDDHLLKQLRESTSAIEEQILDKKRVWIEELQERIFELEEEAEEARINKQMSRERSKKKTIEYMQKQLNECRADFKAYKMKLILRENKNNGIMIE